jgi:hypothetical protein
MRCLPLIQRNPPNPHQKIVIPSEASLPWQAEESLLAFGRVATRSQPSYSDALSGLGAASLVCKGAVFDFFSVRFLTLSLSPVF